MNIDSNYKQNLQWDVDRYLLSDPTLDRDAFEQRMLEDQSLAELVALSVADLQSILSAAQVYAKHAEITSAISTNQSSTTTTYRSATTIHWWALLITAAVLLVSVSVWQYPYSPNDAQLSQIADNWTAFEGLSTAESLELIATEEPANDSHVDADATEQSDWLVEAAREFYIAKNEGAAG